MGTCPNAPSCNPLPTYMLYLVGETLTKSLPIHIPHSTPSIYCSPYSFIQCNTPDSVRQNANKVHCLETTGKSTTFRGTVLRAGRQHNTGLFENPSKDSSSTAAVGLPQRRVYAQRLRSSEEQSLAETKSRARLIEFQPARSSSVATL